MTYPLSNAMWQRLRQFKNSEADVFLYIKTLDTIPSITEIAHGLRLPKITVHRAINALTKLGYLTAEEVAV
jgi:DNA-binding transcriptional regulator YhcF (GntR family)